LVLCTSKQRIGRLRLSVSPWREEACWILHDQVTRSICPQQIGTVEVGDARDGAGLGEGVGLQAELGLGVGVAEPAEARRRVQKGGGQAR
jgi:hypothetical protein